MGLGRFLVVAAWPPWGRGSGYYQRFDTLLHGLRRHGVVDLCLVAEHKAAEHDDVPGGFGEVTWLQAVRTAWWAPKVVLGLASPVRQTAIHPSSIATARDWFARDYDLTWCVEQRAYQPVADLVRAPIVLDLLDVMSSNVRYKRRLVLRHPFWAAALRQVIHQPEYVPGVERQWRRWETAVVGSCDRVVVCSDLDRTRLGGHSAVVPNTYPVPARPAGRQRAYADGLHIGMVGFFNYQPNLDGAHWFATEMLPRVQQVEPEATLHLIGKANAAAIARLGGRPGVIVHGFVDDLEEHLARLSVIIAPVRFGGGTRVKILEAFAHEIPVVSTTMGAEGLGARDSEHLLLRDDPESFARAVVELHHDESLRARLVAAAKALHADRFTSEHGVRAIERELASLTGLVRTSEP